MGEFLGGRNLWGEKGGAADSGGGMRTAPFLLQISYFQAESQRGEIFVSFRGDSSGKDSEV